MPPWMVEAVVGSKECEQDGKMQALLVVDSWRDSYFWEPTQVDRPLLRDCAEIKEILENDK